eukprot:1100927-Alexandrium_andersonii.AAC.1
MVHHLRSTGSQRITLWHRDLRDAATVTCSDCGGVGSASNGGDQAAWVVGVGDDKLARGEVARASVVSW